jgi:hypothetical protein
MEVYATRLISHRVHNTQGSRGYNGNNDDGNMSIDIDQNVFLLPGYGLTTAGRPTSESHSNIPRD